MLIYLITNLMYYGALTVTIISILLSLRNTLIYIIITISFIMYLIISKLNHGRLVVCIAILLTFLIVIHHHLAVDLNRSNIVALLKVLFDLR